MSRDLAQSLCWICPSLFGVRLSTNPPCSGDAGVGSDAVRVPAGSAARSGRILILIELVTVWS